MTDLLKLAERVEAGMEWPGTQSPEWLFLVDICQKHRLWMGALDGSLDAAKVLHDAMLPGWVWSIDAICNDVEVNLYPPNCTPNIIKTGIAPTPAAAWVAAILRAKAAEQ